MRHASCACWASTHCAALRSPVLPAAGKDEYHSYVLAAKRSLLEVMQDFPSARPSLGGWVLAAAAAAAPAIYGACMDGMRAGAAKSHCRHTILLLLRLLLHLPLHLLLHLLMPQARSLAAWRRTCSRASTQSPRRRSSTPAPCTSPAQWSRRQCHQVGTCSVDD